MSLNSIEKRKTIAELKANFQTLGNPFKQAAIDLDSTEAEIGNVLNLNVERIEDPWILKNYLHEQLLSKHLPEVPYSKLSGDYHSYWFLNSEVISTKKLS